MSPDGPTKPRCGLEDLLELTNRLSEAFDAEEVARVVVDQAKAAIGAVTSILWTVDDPRTHATLVRAAGLRPEALAQYERIPLERWLPMGDAMLRCEALFFESRAEFRARYEVAERMVSTANELSYACLPLVVQGRATGGLSLVFPGSRAFDEDERRFLKVLAHHAAQALERASLFAREKQSRERMDGLQWFTSALSSVATVQAVAALATRIPVEILGYASAMLWVTDEQDDLILAGEHGTHEENRETFRHIAKGSSLPAARVARDRRPLWCESERDVESEHPSVVAAVRRDHAMRAYAVLSLVRDDRVLGVLGVNAGRPRRFEPEERDFLTTVVEHCADALSRARLHDDARGAEQLLKSVLGRLPVGVIVTRPPDSTLVLANEAISRIWRAGAFPERFEDRFEMLKVKFPDGRPMPMTESPVVRALSGQSMEGMEARIERQDGTEGWVQISAAPVLRDDGTVKAAVATVVDMSAVKEARAAADEAGRTKDEFLAMLGHELRNPLTPIVTSLGLMDLTGGEAFRAERTTISRQVRHMVRLVDDLLDISRITRGKILLQRVRVEAARVIADAVEIAQPLFEEREQNVTISAEEQGLLLDVDPGRIAQAIANLLTNAAKYTEPHGSIAITAHKEGGQVCIRVRDSGIGIDPQVVATVFEPFFQVERSIDRSQGGLGIGLSVARSLVELHGGAVAAHSDGIGRGSEFLMRLPLAPAMETTLPAPGTPPAPKAVATKAWRVLVVDDNRDITDALSAVLKMLGCIICVARDGPSAIAAAADFGGDLALLDIGLPLMDGYEVARRLRANPATKAMRLIAVTGYGQAKDQLKTKEAGFDEHLVKPFDLDAIRSIVARLDRGTKAPGV